MPALGDHVFFKKLLFISTGPLHEKRLGYSYGEIAFIWSHRLWNVMLKKQEPKR